MMESGGFTIFTLNLVLAWLLLFGGVRNDARGQSAGPVPKKIDTYGDIIEDDAGSHLDYFLNEIQKEPGSKGYIIAYTRPEDPPGTARRYALRSRAYLVKVHGLDQSRVVALDGGRREDVAIELWVAPAGAPAPAPTPTAAAEPDDPGDNLLYDKYSDWDVNWSGLEDGDTRLAGFAAALKREPRAWACIIVYSQNGDDEMGIEWDRPGTALKSAISTKSYLVKKFDIAPSRITAVDGGYSKGRKVTLWIMRPRAKFDSGPFLYSDRLKVVKSGQLRVEPHQEITKDCCYVCRRQRLRR